MPAFYVDLALVTVGEYGRFRAAAGDTGLDTGPDDESAVGVSWQGAQGYARWAGRELASIEQWDRAVDVGMRLSGPRGMVRQPGRANPPWRSSRSVRLSDRRALERASPAPGNLGSPATLADGGPCGLLAVVSERGSAPSGNTIWPSSARGWSSHR